MLSAAWPLLFVVSGCGPVRLECFDSIGCGAFSRSCRHSTVLGVSCAADPLFMGLTHVAPPAPGKDDAAYGGMRQRVLLIVTLLHGCISRCHPPAVR